MISGKKINDGNGRDSICRRHIQIPHHLAEVQLNARTANKVLQCLVTCCEAE